MKTRLEHANLTVRDADTILGFVRTAFPDFHVRFEGRGFEGERLVHVGNDDTYLALHESRHEPAESWVPYGGRPGLNHLGYEVTDSEALRERMNRTGYKETTVPNAHPHRKRVYFEDPEGNDWEFIEYLTEDPALRNDYEIPDLA